MAFTINIVALVIVVGLGASACVSVHRPAIEPIAAITLTGSDSPIVKVDAMRLDRKVGVWVVSGRVVRHSPTSDPDTTNSHLLVTLFNAQGRAVRELHADFVPRLIPRGHKMPGSSTFQLELDSMPIETTRLEIRAYEGTSGTRERDISP